MSSDLGMGPVSLGLGWREGGAFHGSVLSSSSGGAIWMPMMRPLDSADSTTSWRSFLGMRFRESR